MTWRAKRRHAFSMIVHALSFRLDDMQGYIRTRFQQVRKSRVEISGNNNINKKMGSQNFWEWKFHVHKITYSKNWNIQGKTCNKTRYLLPRTSCIHDSNLFLTIWEVDIGGTTLCGKGWDMLAELEYDKSMMKGQIDYGLMIRDGVAVGLWRRCRKEGGGAV
jgi:hypothetical protein